MSQKSVLEVLCKLHGCDNNWTVDCDNVNEAKAELLEVIEGVIPGFETGDVDVRKLSYNKAIHEVRSALKKLFAVLLLTFVLPGIGWAEDCVDNRPGWNVYVDGRAQYQQCRIANALEQIASHLKDGQNG